MFLAYCCTFDLYTQVPNLPENQEDFTVQRYHHFKVLLLQTALVFCDELGGCFGWEGWWEGKPVLLTAEGFCRISQLEPVCPTAMWVLILGKSGTQSSEKGWVGEQEALPVAVGHPLLYKCKHKSWTYVCLNCDGKLLWKSSPALADVQQQVTVCRRWEWERDPSSFSDLKSKKS